MKSLVFRAAVWLLAEIFLTVLGLDDIADYSEYLLQDKPRLQSQSAVLIGYECYLGDRGLVCRVKGQGPENCPPSRSPRVLHLTRLQLSSMQTSIA